MRYRIPFRYSTIIVRTEGEREVERAIVADVDGDRRVVPGTERTIEVDTVLLGYGMESSTEVTRHIGCEHRYDSGLGGWMAVRDEWMRTSVAGVYAAGRGSGVASAPTAIAEGRVAGIAAAVELGRVTWDAAGERSKKTVRRLQRLKRFTRAMAQLYPVGPGLYELAGNGTVVCRCEEVTAATLDDAIHGGVTDPNALRTLTRAGIARCQGRNCASRVAATIATKTGRAPEEVELSTVRPHRSRLQSGPSPLSENSTRRTPSSNSSAMRGLGRRLRAHEQEMRHGDFDDARAGLDRRDRGWA